ncbi:MAG: hypothetical protein COB16_10985 [Rhodobacteraceae bacterium]|nr:MAG: hypothetical protein COB16_10985 [Paracoccaceae bacterium]
MASHTQRIFKRPAQQTQMQPIGDLMRTGQFREALTLMQPMVEADPMNAALLETVSDCYWRLGLNDRAISILKAIVET